MKSLWSLVSGVILFSVFFSACSDGEEEVVKTISDYEMNGMTIKNGIYTDKRNNREYRIVKMKMPQVMSDAFNLWFAENLDYVDSTLEESSWCYENSKDSCKVYGRLYSWEAAQKACPEGWHLPSHDEWNDLYLAVGDRIEPAGTKLKTIDHWQNAESIMQGSNRFGFYGLPAGRKNVEGGWLPTGKFAYFWTSTAYSEDVAYGWQLTYETDMFNYGEYYTGHGMSVRCVATYPTWGSNDINIEGDFDSTYLDEIPLHMGELKYEGQTYKTVEIRGKTYMAENMNYKTGNSWCYVNSADSCKKYGRLYDRETAANVCPEGWKLMTIAVSDDVDTSERAAILRIMGTTQALYDYTAEEIKSIEGWVKEPGNNLSGFNLFPTGGYDIGSESFFDMGYTAYLWVNRDSAAEDADGIVSVGLRYYDVNFNLAENGENFAYAVRCMKE